MATSCRLTSPLPDAAWDNALWLSAADAPIVEGQVAGDGCSAEGASWFRSTITNGRKVAAARWMTAGLGVYELYVNGERIGEEVLKPGFTHPLKTKRSFTYDITEVWQRKAGQANAVAVQVTPGWWGDKIVTPDNHHGTWGTRCAFRGVVELTYIDGTTAYFSTDTTTWRAAIAGPVIHAGIFEGETYDARQPMPFVRDAQAENTAPSTYHFQTPIVNREFGGQVVPNNGAEVYQRHDLALKPVEAYIWKGVDGATDDSYGKVHILRRYAPEEVMTLHAGETLVVDFGQNAAAVPAFTFKAATGTVLTCLPGELLNDGEGAKSRRMDGPEGSVHRRNLRTEDKHMRLVYTFADADSYVYYCPRSTFFGYRYAAITATDDVLIKHVESIPVTSISAAMETGFIETGDADINRLISNTLWGMRSNYLSVPTDCPQRNERQGWTADTQVFAATGTFFARTDDFFHKWTHDLRDTQSPQGGFPGVAPVGQYGDAGMMRVGWADAGVIVPWTIWKQFGDSTIVEENWEAMQRYVEHINSTRYDHTALSSENGNYQWADWLSYEPLESCGGTAFEGGRPKDDAISYWSYLSANYWAIDARMMADMAAATGRDAAPYRQMQATARQYLRDTFFNADGSFKTPILNTMQTPALFALYNKLLDGTAREQLISRLRNNFSEHDGCLQTGFLGTSILMSTLTENGMADIAYDLLFQRRNPSWLYSVDNGATTVWERWNSYMKDKGMGPQGMNSFNHYAYGCVCQWLWESAAGIAADPRDPGFHHIIMRPVPDRRLGYLNAEYRSAAGVIKSSWRYEDDKWTWSFTIPEGATASVFLPHQAEGQEYKSGKYTVVVRDNEMMNVKQHKQ